MKAPEPFNPLTLQGLGWSFAEALEQIPLRRLDSLERFYGAGIYVLYYDGPLEYYGAIAVRSGSKRPIYIGSAMPPGVRQGKAKTEGHRSLYERIMKHRRSITATLDPAHFLYKAIVIEPAFIALGESLLIARFAPVWNQLLDGFGNNALGSGRNKATKTSRWDTLHSGRSDTGPVASEYTKERIIEEVKAHLAMDPLALSPAEAPPAVPVETAPESKKPRKKRDKQ